MKTGKRGKRLIALILALAFTLSFGFAGCSDSSEKKPNDSPKAVAVAVNFDVCGGKGTASMRELTVGEKYGELPSGDTVTKTGYTFGGWWTEANGAGTEIKADTVVTNDKNHTLYAKWTAIESTVTLNPSGGSVTPSSVQVSYDGVYGNLPSAQLAGHTFMSWRTDAGGEGDAVTAQTKVTATEDHTLYADYDANVYSLKFDLGEGGWVDGKQAEFADKSVTFGEAYGPLPVASDVSLSDKYFGGWWTEDSFTRKVFKTTEVTHIGEMNGIHTLYAKWLGIDEAFTVKFVTYNDVTLANIYVGAGEAYGDLPQITKNGYAFGGWYTQENGEGEKVTAETIAGAANEETVIYAKWIAGKSTVTLNDNYGDISQTREVETTYDAAMPSESVPVRTGYNFEGYYDNAEGTGAQYYNSDMTSAKNWDKTDSAVTLYAKWTQKTSQVTLNANYGDAPAQTTVEAVWGEEMPVASLPSRLGYFFRGFYTSADWKESGSERYYGSTLKSEKTWDREDGEITLYARWSKAIDFSDEEDVDVLELLNVKGGDSEIVEHNGKKALKITPSENLTDITLNALLQSGESVITAVDFEYEGEDAVHLVPNAETQTDYAGIGMRALLQFADKNDATKDRDYFRHWHTGKILGTQWQGERTVRYTPHASVNSQKLLRFELGVTPSADLTKFAMYISNIDLHVLQDTVSESDNSSKTTFDFSDPNDIKLFEAYADSTGDVDFSIGGEVGARYLEARISNIDAARSPKYVNLVVYFNYLLTSSSNKKVVFEAQPIYYSTEDGNTLLSGDGDCTQENSVCLITYGIGQMNNAVQDFGAGRSNSTQVINTGTAFDKSIELFYYPASSQYHLGIQVRINKNVDFSKFAVRIYKIQVINK